MIPAVANALFDALGVLVNEVPITPEKVRAVIDGRYRAPRMPDFQYPEVVIVPPLEAAHAEASPVVPS